MILHIVPDEKFIDFAYDEFEKVTSNNKFLVLSDNTNKEFKYIKSPHIKKISIAELLNQKFIDKLHEYDFIVLHELDRYKIKLILNAPKEVIFVWLGWGADYYSYIVGDNEHLLLPKTKGLWKKKNLKLIIKKIIKKIIFYKASQLKALKRIDYFAPIIPNEYELLKNSLENFGAKYIPFSYGNLNDMLKGIDVDTKLGSNVLLGNSASYTNNHIEALDLISKFSLGNRKVITPLSYGDKKYGEYIKRYAQLKINDNFMPLDTFMEKEQYHNLLLSCSVVIMNHLRQQALGNILTMMYMGAKIYLDRRNPIFDFFSDKGAFIYDINDFVPENPNALRSNTKEEILVNRKILEKYWSVDAVDKKVQTLICTVKEHL